MKSLVIITLGAAIATAALPTLALDGYTSPMVVPAAAFHNDGVDPDGFFFRPDGYLEGEGSPVMMYAAVYLPNFATVDSITLNAVDGSDSCTAQASVQAILNRASMTTETIYQMARASTTGASSTMQSPTTSSIGVATIDNLYYRYYLRVQFCSTTHRFYSVEIHYSE